MSELKSLPLFHQIKGKPVLVLGGGEAAEPKRRFVSRAGGVVVRDEEQAIKGGARLAFIALDDADECEKAAGRLRERGLLVNVVDQPELCDFTTPSILDRNPVLIAVGTGGASAGLAKHVRLRLERILPARLGDLAAALFRGRAKLRASVPDGRERRRLLDSAMQEGGPLDPLDQDSPKRVGDWLERPDMPAHGAAGTISITLVDGDPDGLTIRQARYLGVADTILFDPDVPASILARARADAARFEMQDTSKTAEREGLTVVLKWRPAN